MNRAERFYSFDALRALLAIFGLFLHSIYFHIGVSHQQGSMNQALIMTQGFFQKFFIVASLWVHSFRMPAFFALSGFFSFYLFQKLGFAKTAANRIKRIMIPFLVLWFVPVLFSFLQQSHQAAGNSVFAMLSYVGTFWFLYFLIIFDAILLLVLKFCPGILEKSRVCSKSALIGLFLLSLVSALLSKTWYTSTSIDLIPNLTTIFYYACFFAFGVLFSAGYSLKRFGIQKFWALGFVFSILFISVYWWLFSDFHGNFYDKILGEGLWAFLPWIMIPTLFFLFESIASKPNKVWRYLADSSYWVYIAQMPILAVLSLVFYYEKTSILVSIPAMCLISLGILLLSYHIFIRKRRYLNYIDGARTE